jgi:hypothetical protein
MRVIAVLCSLFLLSCAPKKEPLSAEEIIEKSIQFHDANKQWNSAKLSVHMQEPRVGNPKRFSVVNLNNQENSFQLQRNRDTHVSKHIVDKNGQATTLLDNAIVTDSILIKKYRLEPKRNANYHRFYKVMLGLPMSLPENIQEIKEISEVDFNNHKSYKVEIVLKEPLFSKNWYVFFSQKDFKVLGVEMFFPNDPNKGERLVFEGEFESNGIKIPRMKHWYELNNEYSGSDIIVSKLKE